MWFDGVLWASLRDRLAPLADVVLHEVHFFGGRGATIDLNLAVACLEGDLVVNVGESAAQFCGRGDVVAAEIDGEACPGWVRVPNATHVADDDLDAWTGIGVARVRSLARFTRSAWLARVGLGFAPDAGRRAVGFNDVASRPRRPHVSSGQRDVLGLRPLQLGLRPT